MYKYFLLLIPFILTARGYNQNEICKNVAEVSKEAKFIYKKFNDPTNALILLNGSVFRNITYRKPSCMSDKEYMHYLDEHVLYMSKSKNNYSFRSIENYRKKYPQHLYFDYALGKSYENQYKTQKNPQYREKALEVYKSYVKKARIQHVKVEKSILSFIKSGGLLKAKSTWGKYLNPTGDIPLGEFRAYYIDTHHPKRVVATELVNDIGVNYPYNKFHNIDSASFGGYWVGRIKVKKETQKMIYVSQSNASTRVIIDGYIVYDGTSRGGAAFTFKKGVHTIEVEHLNRWHTTELSVKILDKLNKLDAKELHKALEKVVTKKTKFLYVGVYESEKKNSSITLKIQKSKRPLVLLLQSYRAVIWEIENRAKSNIQAIVINSYSPEATIRGDIKGVKIIYAKRRVGSGYNSGQVTKRSQKCVCISGHFSCGGSGGFSADTIPQGFSKKVRGFSGKYAASILAVPQLIMSDAQYREIEAYKSKIGKMRAECTKNVTLQADDLFK